MDFKLRNWKISDAQYVQKYANNKKIADNLRNAFPHPYTLQDAENYINEVVHKDEKCQCCRAIIISGEVVGSIGLFLKDDVYCKSAEIGYWLAEPYWGRGIMSSAIKYLCKFAFEQYDIVRIYAEPFEYNTGSRKALEKAGFILEGIKKKSIYKNGNFFNSCIYALIK